MSTYKINKDVLNSLEYDTHKKELTINWDVGGREGAVCGLVLKVDLVDHITTSYKSPYIPYNKDYNEAF